MFNISSTSSNLAYMRGSTKAMFYNQSIPNKSGSDYIIDFFHSIPLKWFDLNVA